MTKTVVTAAEVQQVGSNGVLNVPADAVVTPLARDVAAELGVTINRTVAHVGRPRGGDDLGAAGEQTGATRGRPRGGDDLADRVRAIVESLLEPGGGGRPTSTRARPSVKHANIRDARLSRFPYPGPPADMQVDTVDVVGADDGSPVAAGYMSISRGSFPWTLTYDEVQIVLEGELHLGGDAGGKIGRPGDVLFVPKGSSITFGTPTWAKFVYVTFPANWEDQIE